MIIIVVIFNHQRPSAIRIDQLDRKVTTPVVKVKCFNDSDDDSQEDAGKRDRKKSEGKKEKTSVGDGMRETDRKGPTFPLIIHQVSLGFEKF